MVSDFLELPLLGFDLGETATTGAYATMTVLTLVGTVLLLVGLVGLYVGQSEAAGVLGLVGFLGSFVGTVLVAGAVWEATFVVPSLAREALGLLDKGLAGQLALGFVLSYTLAGVGVVLFGWPRSGLAFTRGGCHAADSRRGACRNVELRSAAPA